MKEYEVYPELIGLNLRLNLLIIRKYKDIAKQKTIDLININLKKGPLADESFSFDKIFAAANSPILYVYHGPGSCLQTNKELA